MREATNLNWTDTPFGGARRPFANWTSLLAAFTIDATDGSPTAAAVYLPLPRARSLTVTDTTVRFGFYAVAAEEPTETAAVAASVDALLVQARRQAVILAGHRLADELAALTATGAGQPSRGITAVRAAWHSQPAERGLARLYDTGSEPAPATLADVCAAHHLHGLSLDVPPAAATTSRAAPQILRQRVIRALAIALIAAVNAGNYQWDALHLDAVVEAAAWDQLTDLSATPVR
ncbi:hypothetical protein Franean1_2621 [Parafrankia sp. EAN1pec]|uniref:hypothetical protein n=1 Tax=Parafrankia sp. (strain EAN1pec) TaxID=298653 RepID=UPI000054021A|nr:hypothetical protein Franean1_2621 [Frankia sp. EAN1pec]